MKFVNNVTIGNVQGAVAAGSVTNFYALEDMTIGGTLGGNGFTVNEAWVNYPTVEAYEEEQARAKVP